MSNAADFEIENGVLKKYRGNDAQITIPNSVTSIGDRAFSYCIMLTDITIPDSVTRIGYMAFSDCSRQLIIRMSSLETYMRLDIDYPHRLYINDELVTDVIIRDGVTSIGDCAFRGCESLKSITIPESVTYIGNYVFNGCSDQLEIRMSSLEAYMRLNISHSHRLYINDELVTDVVIPDGVTSIGEYAFSGCSSLTSITIPSSVTSSIGYWVFNGCSDQLEIRMSSLEAYMRLDISHSHQLYINDELVTSVVIPDGVTSIGNDAFSGCSSLTSISLPSTLKRIGKNVFDGCTSLEYVMLPESVEIIEDYQLDGNTNPKRFSGTEILAGKTLYCAGITKVVIPEGITELEKKCFSSSKQLKEVVLPSTLKKIGASAFEYCGKLKTITGGSGAVAWGEYALRGCQELNYTAEMFRNTAKLCDSFADHLSVCDPEELAFCLMYQKGKEWERALPKQICKDNACLILQAMTDHIAPLKTAKKQAAAAAEFVKNYPQFLEKDPIQNFLDVLNSKKCWELSDALQADPAVAAKLNGEEKKNVSDDEVESVQLDGTIRRGLVKEIPLRVGACFRMGTGEKNLWRILDLNETKHTAFVIADVDVCKKAYNEEDTAVTWETCTLHKWLNEEYFSQTFSEAEKSAIIESEIHTPDNTKYNTKGGNDTKDRIFLLSLEEAKKYFKDAVDRSTGSWWWLRSPGRDQNYASGVSRGGSVDYFGYAVFFTTDCVRPAFKINLESEFFKSLISINSNGETVIRNPNPEPQLIIRSGTVFSADRNLISVKLPAYVQEIAPCAFRGCAFLEKVEWENEEIKVNEDSFSGCPKVQLPAKFYCTKNKVNEAFLPYLPADAEAFAHLLTYQKKPLPWLRAISEKMTAELMQETASAMKRLSPEAEHPEFLLACGCASLYAEGTVNAGGYKKEALDSYRKLPTADEFAKDYDHAALMTWLADKIKERDAWYAPYAAYADEKELAELISAMNAWPKEGKKGKERMIRVRGAILLNDSKAAMQYADKMNLLDRYAALRGSDADTLRDTVLSDLILDENGNHTWDLGGSEVTVRLNSDLTLALTDSTGKLLKSVPKKNADPEKAEAAAKEFTELKKSVKDMTKLRIRKLFEDFLSGRPRPAKAWQDTYLKNPVLRQLAKLLVWAQDNDTFILNASGSPIHPDGSAYEITGSEIRLAHPMEMGKAATEDWQKYFLENKLAQPFAQVWEPVLDASMLTPDRYAGATITLYMLMNKDLHGITMQGQSELKLQDCSADLKLIEGHKDWINNELEITNFRFDKFTRAVNHIAAHFDKGTVQGRILKDDASVGMWLDQFTLAQIMEFIDLAGKNGCANSGAVLLQYKKDHFPEEDPMDIFTLEDL